ncbi:hypothetical protein GBN33_13735 [Plesiomonas shigelloides]|uniref:hypothetical protein n=1 Tax=Plesiomonas shigelloides TaxID=703 RepID=UPI0012616D64|nr:hypothetical protein [Plesiomonas shigelloides]KAB7696328.1 hypothetical protein GBN33_13735 [Plesiomonas shigelloides]
MDYAKLTVKLHPTEQYSVEKRIQVLRSILDDENASLVVKTTKRVLFYFGSLNYLPKGEFLKNREQCCHYCGLSYNRGYAAAIKEQA